MISSLVIIPCDISIYTMDHPKCFPQSEKRAGFWPEKGHFPCVKFTQKGTFVRADFSNLCKIKDFMSAKRLE